MNFTLRTSALASAVLTIVVGLGACAPQPAAEPTPPLTPARSEVATPVAKPGKPNRVEIPVIAVDEKLHGVGLNPDGSMEMPAFGDAAWYEPGPRPGGAGPAVIVAHVRGPAGADVFSRLHELQPGDEVTVSRTDGASTFVVDGSEQVPKKDLPLDRIWIETDASALRLITCGGEYDPKIGGFPDNTIVYAHLA
jgi:LPXTG-site transpeptidase (sortase) family protein